MPNIRLALEQDCKSIAKLMELAIRELQKGFLSPEQLSASAAGMGLDQLLIADRTYYCVEDEKSGALIGCGGWSRRATLYGGDQSAGRDARLLDPACERARIRAMYTHPEHTRRGIGRLILETAENAAREEGFKELEMAATMAGKPLYLACGYLVESEWFDTQGAVPVPLTTMWKRL